MTSTRNAEGCAQLAAALSDERKHKSSADRARAALAKADAILSLLPQWKGIESAPRDETVLIAVSPLACHPHLRGTGARVYPVYIDRAGTFCDTGSWKPDPAYGQGEGPFFRVTHWMPLPSPPGEDAD